MPCGNEAYRPQNPPLCPRTRISLSQIVAVYNHRRLLDQATRTQAAQLRAQREFRDSMSRMNRAVDAWLEQIEVVENACEELLDRHIEDPSSVTPEDWTQITQGADRKVKVIYGDLFPRESWPEGVLYLNLIALREYYVQHRDSNVEIPGLRDMRERADIEAILFAVIGNLEDLKVDANMDIEQLEED